MEEPREEFLSRKTGRIRKRRSDGWTKREIDIFLTHYRVTANITTSAAAAGKHVRSVYGLRETDAGFAADMERALGECDVRLRSKAIVYAETQGRIPPPREDGEPAEAPMESFDPIFALKVLAHNRDRIEGRKPPGGPRPKSATKEELVQAGMKLLSMLDRRRARQGG